jgi:hypothetical protein
MLIKLNYGNANEDFNWVIRVLNSAETNNQLNVANRCFQLWEKKYVNENLTKIEKFFVSNLRSKYWALFKNKEAAFITYFND